MVKIGAGRVTRSPNLGQNWPIAAKISISAKNPKLKLILFFDFMVGYHFDFFKKNKPKLVKTAFLGSKLVPAEVPKL